MKLTTTTFTMRTCDADVLAQLLGFRLDKLIINQLAYSYIKYMTDDGPLPSDYHKQVSWDQGQSNCDTRLLVVLSYYCRISDSHHQRVTSYFCA